MESNVRAVQIISILTFLFYGSLCLFSDKTITEFKRYGLLRFRRLTGVLEIAGAFGLLCGFYSHLLLFLSSAGLSLLMLCGIIARLRIKDPVLAIIPAFILCLLNGFIFIKCL